MARARDFAGDRGVILPTVLILGAVMMFMIVATLSTSRLAGLVTVNHKNHLWALETAEAGLAHAVAIIPWGVEFDDELAGPDGDPATTADNGHFQGFPLPFPNTGALTSYDVVATDDRPAADGNADPYDDANQRVVLRATGFAPANARATIEAYIGRSGSFRPPGAVHLAGPEVDTNFSGDSFAVDGNDRNPDGTAGPERSVRGISTTDDAVKTDILDNQLSDQQKDNVTGYGGTPSVGNVYPPFSVTELADAILTLPHVEMPGDVYSGNEQIGTPAAPQITLITGDARFTGNASGAGILVVDGSLDISGTFDFQGMIVARGGIEVQITGNAGLFGSLMTIESTTADSDREFDIRGNASVFYSSQALSFVENFLAGLGGSPLPKPASIISWQEIS